MRCLSVKNCKHCFDGRQSYLHYRKGDNFWSPVYISSFRFSWRAPNFRRLPWPKVQDRHQVHNFWFRDRSRLLWRWVVHVLRTTTTNCINCINCVIIINCTNCIISWGGGKPPPQTGLETMPAGLSVLSVVVECTWSFAGISAASKRCCHWTNEFSKPLCLSLVLYQHKKN